MKRLSKKARVCLFSALGVLLALALLILGCNLAVVCSTRSQIQTVEQLASQAESEQAPYDCILVLGALARGKEVSPILQDRMDMGLTLLSRQVSDTLLLTGDSLQPEKNDEVGAMSLYAVESGASEDSLLCDPLGLSTYESLWRAKNVYGMRRIVIVTQAFHLPRAIYLAKQLGMDAYGVVCDARPVLWKNYVRESIARVKAVWDGITLPDVPDPQ